MIGLQPDATFVIQAVSFVIFWQVMKHVLFVPVQNLLDTRTARTIGDRQHAATLQAKAAKLSEETDAALAQARREGTREADEIRRQGESEEQAILERFRAEAAAVLERERAATDAQAEAARTALADGAERLAGEVVAKVLGRPA